MLPVSTDTPARFSAAADAALEDLLRLHPETASELGDHRYDDRLDDRSEEAERVERATIAGHLDALDDLDDEELDAERRVDLAVLHGRLAARAFALDTLQDATRDPLGTLPGVTLHGMLERPYAPAADRLRAVASRLRQLPDRFATAQRRLDPDRVPRVHAETALAQAAGLDALVGGEVGRLLAEEPGLRAEVEPAQTAARAALDGYRAFLHELAEKATGEPRRGERVWRAELWHTLESDLSADEVLARARRLRDETLAEMTETAGRLLGRGGTGDVDPALVREALDLVATDAPADATIMAVAADALAEAWRTTRAADLVTLPDDPLELVEMPEFARGVAVAYCDSPGPLETAPLPTWFAIAPTPADWSAERVASFYREYNRFALLNLAVHEAVPGHHVQLALARRFRGPSRARAAFWSGTFVEGWAVYTERLLVDAGLGGTAPVGHGTAADAVRLTNRKVLLRVVTNALLDQLVHCSDPARDLADVESEAMRLMTVDAFQEDGEAAGKWRRALLTSTQLSTYFVGFTEVSELRRDWDAAGRGPARRFHDELLSHGSPAPKHLRGLLEP